MAGGDPDAVGIRADEREAVGGGGAEAGPGADDLEVDEAGHVLDGAAEHAGEQFGADFGRVVAVLARAADEELAGGAGLDVEGDAFVRMAVGAFEIAELDELMVQEAGVAIGDGEVALARLDGEIGEQAGDAGAAGEDREPSGDRGAVGEAGAVMGEGFDGGVANGGEAEEPSGGAGGVQDAVSRHEQAAGEAGSEFGLGFVQGLGIEDFAGGVEGVFAMDLGHLFSVGGDPDGSAMFALDVGGEGEGVPEVARVFGEGELGGGIVHHDDMAHSGGRGAAADDFWFHDKALGSGLTEGRCNRSADDSSAGDEHVRRQGWKPQANGSCSSIRSLASAVMEAVPVMVGRMRSPSQV